MERWFCAGATCAKAGFREYWWATMNATMNTSILTRILQQIPRLIAQIDRNKASVTYGCCDRQYWHYKTVDFPGARYQECVLVLALLYAHNIQPYNSEKVLEWICAAFRFWAKSLQHGACNEWYPHEQSFVATAFSVCALSEACLVLPQLKKYVSLLETAGNWLLRTDEKTVLNQQAGAALALHNLFLLTGNQKYKSGAEHKINQILRQQHKEGWWYEYNGPDFGYLSLMIDYLSRYYLITNDERVSSAVIKALGFLQHMVHPNGVVAGTCGSRDTQYLVPTGCVVVNHRYLISAVHQSLLSGLWPGTMDDRYLCYMLPHWMLTYTIIKKQSADNIRSSLGHMFQSRYLPYGTTHFKGAGIVIKHTSRYHAVINYNKGGAYSWYDYLPGKTHQERGIVARMTAGRKRRWHTTAHFKGHYLLSPPLLNEGKKSITTFSLIAALSPMHNNKITPLKYAVLRIVQSIFGRNRTCSSFIKGVLRKMLIMKSYPDSFIVRTFVLGKTIGINDTFTERLLKMSPDETACDLYVPSANYTDPRVLK